ncbi:unnamed protein product [Rotaria sordida]|uniref:B box-type domain-containing protein n=1 Tax=Rotaria sordida TaxID=392033 RepID=A0A816A096_9BILA|nr:unnamed protein product [Rotaria sordida]CAF1437644.1 unnamed protein product [Rotaria sordida]CAF1591636.1 unnamed protein product [Rotaria sordida]CAF3785129.1 unnamed protein product [Rotaria sordida]
MSLSSSKTRCTSNDCKNVGILKCEGCSQTFCRTHVIEHRDFLSHQLDGVVLEHDTLQQMVMEQENKENDYHSLFKQIDKWEQDSITKIQQTANEVRQEIETLIGSQREHISKELHDLAKQLRKAREDDDFIETDLRIWTDILEKLKHDVYKVSSSMTVSEDPTKLLVAKIFISSSVSQYLEIDERLEKSIGNVCITENGHLAHRLGLERERTFVIGKHEYSSGKYKIRFVMNKKNSKFVMSFNIISKYTRIQQHEFELSKSSYGWYSDGDTCGGVELPSNKNKYSMESETTSEIEFLLDCDNQKIGYFNERTKNRREMKINLTKCPLPWKLLFYLYDVEDSVRLLSSKQLL